MSGTTIAVGTRFCDVVTMNVLLRPDHEESDFLSARRMQAPLQKRFLISVALFAAYLAPVVSAWSQVDISTSLESIRATYHMPGLLAMAIKDGRIMAQGAAGVRRQGNPTPLLVTDRINIGSCTKWMTATIAGRLVDRGLISWDTKVKDVFTNNLDFAAAFREVTLDQLLAHRGGIESGAVYESKHWSWNFPTGQFAQPGTIQEIRRWTSDTVLKESSTSQIGTYVYANQGYTVVATMLEIVSGKAWETLMDEEIFKRARMTSASLGQVFDAYDVNPANAPRAPCPHYLSSITATATVSSVMSDADEYHYQASTGPGGFVACTLQDWAKFLNLHANSDISGFDYLSPATATRLKQAYSGPGGQDYGRGILPQNRTWATPGQALTHTGDIFLHNTDVWVAPGRRFIIVVFTSCRSGDSSTFNALDAVAGMLVNNYSSAAASGPFLEKPAFLALRFVNGNVALDYLTLPGISYQVETSSELFTWTSAVTTQATSLISIYTDTDPGRQKFYRAKIGP
jgi:CubicO group peptidase (beta-lactamase class C family)